MPLARQQVLPRRCLTLFLLLGFTVADEQDDTYISVPPNQSRDLDKYISGTPLSPKGKIEWNYRVTSVSAKMD